MDPSPQGPLDPLVTAQTSCRFPWVSNHHILRTFWPFLIHIFLHKTGTFAIFSPSIKSGHDYLTWGSDPCLVMDILAIDHFWLTFFLTVGQVLEQVGWGLSEIRALISVEAKLVTSIDSQLTALRISVCIPKSIDKAGTLCALDTHKSRSFYSSFTDLHRPRQTPTKPLSDLPSLRRGHTKRVLQCDFTSCSVALVCFNGVTTPRANSHRIVSFCGAQKIATRYRIAIGVARALFKITSTWPGQVTWWMFTTEARKQRTRLVTPIIESGVAEFCAGVSLGLFTPRVRCIDLLRCRLCLLRWPRRKFLCAGTMGQRRKTSGGVFQRALEFIGTQRSAPWGEKAFNVGHSSGDPGCFACFG